MVIIRTKENTWPWWKTDQCPPANPGPSPCGEVEVQGSQPCTLEAPEEKQVKRIHLLHHLPVWNKRK